LISGGEGIRDKMEIDVSELQAMHGDIYAEIADRPDLEEPKSLKEGCIRIPKKKKSSPFSHPFAPLQ
jgi:hypothetical protein